MPQKDNAFTLIEILVCLAILAVIIVGASSNIIINSKKRKINDVRNELQNLARKSLLIAQKYKKTVKIAFTNKEIIQILPKSLSDKSEKKITLKSTSIQAKFNYEDDWISPTSDNLNDTNEQNDNENNLEWIFLPSGMAQKIFIKISTNSNKSQEIEFHPLTALIVKSESKN